MDFKKVGQNRINSDLKSDKEDNKSAAQNDSMPNQVQEIPSDYSLAQRSLGMSAVHFNGSKNKQLNFQEEWSKVAEIAKEKFKSGKITKEAYDVILRETVKENLPLVGLIISEIENFGTCDVQEILMSTRACNIEERTEIFKLLKNIKDFPMNGAGEIIKHTNKNNFQHKKQMVEAIQNSKKTEPKNSGDIIDSTSWLNIESRKKILALMDVTEDFPSEYATIILRTTEQYTTQLIEEMIKTKGLISSLSKEEMYVLLNLARNNSEYMLNVLRKIKEIGSLPTKFMGNYISNANSYNYEAKCKLIECIKKGDLTNLKEKIENQKEMVMKNPKRYANWEHENEDGAKREAEEFFKDHYYELLFINSILDKETINNLLRLRYEKVEGYIEELINLKEENIKLFSKLTKANNPYGKPLMPKQKIELMYLVKAFEKSNLDTSKIEKMAAEQKVDIAELNLELLKKILEKCGLSEEEIKNIPNEKFTQWDIGYLHLLAEEIEKNKGDTSENSFKDVLIGSNLFDFIEFIHDEENYYGKTNKITEQMFKKHGLNYNAWINPPKTSEVDFVAKDKNTEQLKQITKQAEEDIEILRTTGAKSLIDKNYSKYIKENKFIIPTEIAINSKKLKEFINGLLKQLEPAFKRAESNKNNPQKRELSSKTLTAKNHLEQRIEDISKIKDKTADKDYNLTIKMWDRIPQKDLFQGNYSTCCIGMSEINGEMMPEYLLNTAFNMIEIIDNDTEKTIGNALCYFVTDNDDKPIFIIDNIEIKNSEKPSEKISKKLRGAITNYAKNITKEVTGKNNTKICIGNNYNDVVCNDLKEKELTVDLLGETSCDWIYMDLYDGWVSKSFSKKKVKLLETN